MISIHYSKERRQDEPFTNPSRFKFEIKGNMHVNTLKCIETRREVGCFSVVLLRRPNIYTRRIFYKDWDKAH